MPIQGLVELQPGLEPDEIRSLVQVARQASKDGTMVLVLAGTPVDETLLAQARAAHFVIADSDGLSDTLLSNGILHMGMREGIAYLRGLTASSDRREDGPKDTAPSGVE